MSTVPTVPCDFLHGDIDVFGDIANMPLSPVHFFILF
jgi:hypothetical protein